MTNSPNSNSEPRSESFGKLDKRIQRWIWESGWKELRSAQEEAIPHILANDHDVIVAASTASGKTEAAFFPILTHLAATPEEPKLVVYIGPLKALINDQWQRLEVLCETLEIQVTPWHGDISASQKTRFQRSPRGCLLITPESMEAMLMRQGGAARENLRGTCYVVIDELHSFMGTERGKQLQSLLCRLEQLIGHRVSRVGLSATLGNMDGAKEFLRPGDAHQVAVVSETQGGQELRVLIKGVVAPTQIDMGKDTEEALPDEIAKSNIAAELYATLRGSNNLIFPNSRRSVEFFADCLRRKCEEERVPNEFWPHHGNLSKEIREQTEAALKQKEIPASAICTSTLELGIDIGTVKSVAQIGPPPSVASLRQRLGRSGRRHGEPAILRGFVIENPLTPQSSPSDLLRADLVQLVAMVRLLIHGWYEPTLVDGLHASTLVQQVLSVISQLGGAQPAQLWATLCEQGAFDAVPAPLFGSLLRGLGEKEIIFQDPTGLLLLAEKGEKITGHYSFYAAFSSQEEFRIVCAGRTLGSMPVNRLLTPGSFLIFAGRRWEILSISQEDLEIDVKPAGGGALPNFENIIGSTIHNRVREEMRAVLQSAEQIPFLDQTAQKLLAEARRNYVNMSLDENWIREVGNELHLFLWKGDRIQDTLALVLEARDVSAINYGVYVEVQKTSKAELVSTLLDILDGPTIDPAVLASEVANKFREKWDSLLPGDVLDASFASNNLDVTGTVEALRAVRLSEESM